MTSPPRLWLLPVCAPTLYLGPTIEIIMARPDLLIVNIFPWVGGAHSNLFLYIRAEKKHKCF